MWTEFTAQFLTNNTNVFTIANSCLKHGSFSSQQVSGWCWHVRMSPKRMSTLTRQSGCSRRRCRLQSLINRKCFTSGGGCRCQRQPWWKNSVRTHALPFTCPRNQDATSFIALLNTCYDCLPWTSPGILPPYTDCLDMLSRNVAP